MKEKKSSDYNIININYYASKYLMKKHEKQDKIKPTPFPKQFDERVKAYIEFKWFFVAKVTDLYYDYWRENYMYESYDCALDFIQETTGIMVQRGHEGWVKYYIPKENIELFEWVKEKCELPYKIMKRAHIYYSMRDDNNLKWRREESVKFTTEMHQKFKK